MSFFNSESGTFGMVAGLTALIVAGIAAGTLVQGRFQATRGRAAVHKDLNVEKDRLDSLRQQLQRTEDAWDKGQAVISGAEEWQTLSADLKTSRAAKEQLSRRRQELVDEGARLHAEFDDYQSRYRRQVRNAAVGEKLDEVTSRQGKIYRGVVIRRVTEAGLEITHSEGLASLRPEDLADSWRERFQW